MAKTSERKGKLRGFIIFILIILLLQAWYQVDSDSFRQALNSVGFVSQEVRNDE